MDRDELYHREHYRYLSLLTTNLVNQDLALVQLSGGLLVVLPTFGKSLLTANKTLSYIVIILLFGTIFQVVIGYALSNRFILFTIKQLGLNYKNNDDLAMNLDDNLAGKVNKVLNALQLASFFLAMIFFLALLIIYIGGL